ncbi:MAG TPA: FAD-dependent monooxygenase [Armatimonadota bacterium]|jgi:flavin-dependent dehydrogenase
MYDVAIVGAGPAGAMLARLIGEQYRVLLVDRRSLDRPPLPERPGKCCGGLLSENAQRALASLGLTPPTSIMTGEQPTHVRVIDADNGLERAYPRPYINCHRELLDRWLVSLAPDEVDVRCGVALRALEMDEDGATLHLSADGRQYTERTRLVVGADGAHSPLRRRLFPRAAFPRQYLAIQEWYAPAEPLPYHVAIFDRTVTDFYGWAVSKDGLLAIGAALAPHADAGGHFARLLARFAEYGIIPGKRLWREGALIQRPRRLNEICPGAGRAALIGEAAGWISPSSAEGFSYAFRSAALLAEGLATGLEGAVARYTALAHPLCRAIGRDILKCAGMFTPWVRGLGLQFDRPVTASQSQPARSLLAGAIGH